MYLKRLKKCRVPHLVVFCISAALLYSSPVYGTIVSLDNQMQQTGEDRFRIELLVDSVTDLYGIATMLRYDTEFLDVVDADSISGNGVQPVVSEMTLLNNNGLDITFLRSALEDETPGSLVLGLSRSGAVTGVATSTGRGILSVDFNVKKAGTTIIGFFKSGLQNSNNVAIPVDSWDDALINIDPPDISVSPTFADFGDIVAGEQSAPQTFTVTNAGTVEIRLLLRIGAAGLTGTDAAEFTIENDDCSNHPISPSGNCTVDIIFSPFSAGTKSAFLSIPSNDPDTPLLNMPLTGSGTGAFFDSDGDGMPDAWEIAIFGDIITANEISNFDLDSGTDVEEYEAGSDPKNSNSRPVNLSIVLNAGFNLFGYPLTEASGLTSFDLISTLGDSTEIGSILVYDRLADTYQEAFYNGVNPDGVDAPIGFGDGVIVYSLVEKTVNFNSTVRPGNSYVECIAVDLIAGLNVETFPCVPASYTAFQLLSAVGGDEYISSIERFNPVTGMFESAGYFNGDIVGVNFEMRRGEAYLIYMKQQVLGFSP